MLFVLSTIADNLVVFKTGCHFFVNLLRYASSQVAKECCVELLFSHMICDDGPYLSISL